MSVLKDAFLSTFGAKGFLGSEKSSIGTAFKHVSDNITGYQPVSVRDQITNLAAPVAASLSSSAKGVPDSSGGYASGYTPGAMQNPDYINAALAEHYGMDRSAAYQEALANTAHQREVQDLIAAGLNPVLSAGAGNGAAVFSGDPMASGGGYVGAAGNSSSAKGLENVIKNRNVQQGLASAASGLTMAATKSFHAAATTYFATQAALQFLSK